MVTDAVMLRRWLGLMREELPPRGLIDTSGGLPASTPTDFEVDATRLRERHVTRGDESGQETKPLMSHKSAHPPEPVMVTVKI
jgi:hypothetical protein